MMTLEERFKICKTCDNRKVDYEKGVVCQLTNEKPDFEETCVDYKDIPSSQSYPVGVKENIGGTSQIYRPNKQRAQRLIYSLVALLLVEPLSTFGTIYLSQKMFTGTENGNLQLYSIILIILGVTLLVLAILVIVFFIQWFRRAYYNLHLRFSSLKYTEVRAVWCWFIPILNLIQPYEIMKEMWTKTYDLVGGSTSDKYSTYSSALVGFWWFAFLFNNIISYSAQKAIHVPEYYLYPINIAAGVLAIIMVKRYSNMEETVRNSGDMSSEIDQITGISE
jgi:hypothetical protein